MRIFEYFEYLCCGIVHKWHSFYDKSKDVNNLPDYIAAHDYSSNHKPELERDGVCGCFCCLEIFAPKEIQEWIIDRRGDPRGTAVCPYCGIDSVIGESSGYPITKEFLEKMKKHWC